MKNKNTKIAEKTNQKNKFRIKMEEEKAKKQQKNESHVETVLPVNNTGQPSSPSIGKLTSIGDVFERK